MRRPLRSSVFVLATALAASACARSSDALSGRAQPSGSAQPAEQTEMHVGETRIFGRDDLTITFEAVTNESRCPMDALCITMGEATTRFAIAPAGGSAVTRELRTGAPDSTSATVVGRYMVKLDALAPYPQSGRVVDLPNYTATITVRSR